MKSGLQLILCFFFLWTSCSPKTLPIAVVDEDLYRDELSRWRNDRIRMLTSAEGWLSLVGLYWLKNGKNTLGSSSKMDVVMEDPAAPDRLGVITLNEDGAYFESAGEAYVTVDGQRFIEGPVYTENSGELSKMKYKSLVFYLIERNGRIGLRVKNTLADKRYTLKEIDHYPTDAAYHIYATKNTKAAGETVRVEDITGDIQDYKLEAELNFFLGGKKQSLLAFDGGPDYYFVIFKDLSNNLDTYGGGRYMYIPRATDEEGRLILDFNKAFNPPCVFTDYATCPIPPEANKLHIDVRAGEKYPINFVSRY